METDAADNPLTLRQIRILGALAEGLTIGEVADRLALARDVANRHLRDSMKALGTCTRLQAIVLTRERGWIELPAIAVE